MVKKYCEAAGIDPSRLGARGIGIHSLRKTAINDAIRNGAAMHEVREFAGHADIRTTEVYFVRKEEDAEVAARGASRFAWCDPSRAPPFRPLPKRKARSFDPRMRRIRGTRESDSAGAMNPAACHVVYPGQARSAVSATRRSSSRLAPPAAWTAIPWITVVM